MAGGVSREIIEGFIEEVGTYLPLMFSCINKLKNDASQLDILKNLYRLIHTIKGAASMVDLQQLSGLASYMEEILENVIENNLLLTPELLEAFQEAVKQITYYCEEFPLSAKQEKELLEKTAKVIGDAVNSSAGKRDMNASREDKFHETVKLLIDESLLDELSPDDCFDDFLLMGNDELASKDVPRLDEVAADDVMIEADNKKIESSDALLAGFAEEAAEHLDNISTNLNLLAKEVKGPLPITSSIRSTIQEVRRLVHTMKGAAAMMDMKAIADWGHNFEDFLDWLYEKASVITPEIVETMFDASDILEGLTKDSAAVFDAAKSTLMAKFAAFMESPAPSMPEIVKPQGTILEKNKASGSEEQEDTPSYLEHSDMLKVDLKRVDKMVGMVGEMSIAMSGMDLNVNKIRDTLGELKFIAERLKRIVSTLEEGYELATIPHIGKEAAVGNDAYEEFDPLELDRYSELNIVIRSLAETYDDLSSVSSHATNIRRSFENNLTRQKVVMDQLQEAVAKVRMAPLSVLSNRMRQTVRKMVKETGKKVNLIIRGEELEMDKRVWDKLADPLMHLLRNAIDHGIEMPDQRLSQGKSPEGVINVVAARKGNQFILELYDDGLGLDYEAIKRMAQKTMSPAVVNHMTQEELKALIFQPGFTSKSNVTEFSGRGVGLDVVKSAVNDLGGTIECTSEQGEGVKFVVRLPVRAALFRALLAKIGGQIFAFHMNEIERITTMPKLGEGEDTVKIGEEELPLIDPGRILGLPASLKSEEEKPLLVIIRIDDKHYGLKLTKIIDQRDVVFKDLGSHLKKVPFVSGVTVMGDGTLVPILNLEELLNTEVEDGDVESKAADERVILNIMVVDDSVSVRRVLANFIKEQGWRLYLARDGVECLELVRKKKPDVILLDIEMPRMNGFEVLKALRADSNYRDIPVFMLTSRGAQKYIDKASSLGAQAFITKPFKERELIQLIDTHTQNGNAI